MEVLEPWEDFVSSFSRLSAILVGTASDGELCGNFPSKEDLKLASDRLSSLGWSTES